MFSIICYSNYKILFRFDFKIPQTAIQFISIFVVNNDIFVFKTNASFSIQYQFSPRVLCLINQYHIITLFMILFIFNYLPVSLFHSPVNHTILVTYKLTMVFIYFKVIKYFVFMFMINIIITELFIHVCYINLGELGTMGDGEGLILWLLIKGLFK